MRGARIPGRDRHRRRAEAAQADARWSLAAVSNPLIHMVDSGALADVAEVVEFVPWRDPDQLRVMALDGRADVLAMPTNVAANLYNRGAKLRMLNVSNLGCAVAGVARPGARVACRPARQGTGDALPRRHARHRVPVARRAAGHGLRRGPELRYVASPIDAMQLLVMRRVDHALLASRRCRWRCARPGPSRSASLRRSCTPAVGTCSRNGARVFARATRIPQAGIAVMGALASVRTCFRVKP